MIYFLAKYDGNNSKVTQLLGRAFLGQKMALRKEVEPQLRRCPAPPPDP